MTSADKHRAIRSYVLRTGRMTPGQQKAYARHWQRFGLDYANGQLRFEDVFSRCGPVTLEIGFGMGDSLVDMAAANPERNFIGIEVHTPGVGRLFHAMEAGGVENIRAYSHDAVEVLRDCIPDASLDRVQIYFPDPWHKKRHHKRRLIQPAFVALLAEKLADEGELHLATDWENYAEHMMEVMTAAQEFTNSCDPQAFAPRPTDRPETKFERRGARLGHGVWDLIFVRDTRRLTEDRER